MSENTTNSQPKHEIKNSEQKIAVSPINDMIEAEEQSERENEPEKSQEDDALLLIEELKERFKIIGEKSKEIAYADGRTIVTHDDAEHAIQLIREENARKKIEEYVTWEEENLEICPYCGIPISKDEFKRYKSCCLCVLEGEKP